MKYSLDLKIRRQLSRKRQEYHFWTLFTVRFLKFLTTLNKKSDQSFTSLIKQRAPMEMKVKKQINTEKSFLSIGRRHIKKDHYRISKKIIKISLRRSTKHQKCLNKSLLIKFNISIVMIMTVSQKSLLDRKSTQKFTICILRTRPRY